MAAQLAFLGTAPSSRPLLIREIAQLKVLSDGEVLHCGWSLKKAWKGTCSGASKVANFARNHATEIAVGAALCATRVGIAYVTGYTLSVAVCGVVVAGASSIFTQEEKPNPYIPNVPPPLAKHELAIAQQGLPSSLPMPALPASHDEFLVTPQGVWANGQFFSNKSLMERSTFREQFSSFTYANSSIAESAKFFDPTSQVQI